MLLPQNRGLCGAFNSGIIKTAIRVINEQYPEQFKSGNLSIYCIGKKVTEYFTKRGFKVYESNNHITESVNFEKAVEIAEKVLKEFSDGTFDKIDIIYNQFKNAASQQIVREQYLPIIPPEKTEEQKKTEVDYIFEPDKKNHCSGGHTQNFEDTVL